MSATGEEARPVLVVGATGRTGRLIVDRLVERSIPVRALVRDAATGRALLPAAVERLVGDVRHAETLAAPMEGARAMIVATCGSPEHDNSSEVVDYFGNRSLFAAAAAADVGFVVFISSIYASRPEHYQDVDPDSLGWKARAEEVLRQSGLAYTIVRAGWLLDRPGGAPLELSRGDVAEGHLSREDLADVCVRALLDEDARGKTFEVVAAHADSGASFEATVAALPGD